MSRIIGIVSGKGGVGKTTLTANLGFYLSSVGKKVTIVDCNVTTSHLGFNFGIYYYGKTLNNVLKGEANLEEATYKYKNLNIIPASLTLSDLINLDISTIGRFVRQIETEFILIDSAPGIGREPMSVLNSVDEVLIITIPYLNAIADVLRIKKILSSLNLKPLGIVLNMVKSLNHELSSHDVEKITDLRVLGEIPYDENVNKALAFGSPVLEIFPFSPSSLMIKKIGDILIGQSYQRRRTFRDKLLQGFRRIFLRKRIVDLEELI